MSEIDITLLCSGIRTENWHNHFSSFLNVQPQISVDVVCIGPRVLPDELKSSNVQFVHDFGSPTRGLQIAASMAKGRRIIWSSDDGAMADNAQNAIWDIVKDQDRKTVVLGKYTEGQWTGKKAKKSYSIQMRDTYYKVSGSSYTASVYVPDDWHIANHAYIDKSYFIELGGLDCRFESAALATTDWAIRAQRDGAKFILVDLKVWELGFDGERGGYHGPIYDAFMQNDWPLYRSIYDDPDCINRIKIDFDNWKESPEVWARRFPEGKPV